MADQIKTHLANLEEELSLLKVQKSNWDNYVMQLQEICTEITKCRKLSACVLTLKAIDRAECVLGQLGESVYGANIVSLDSCQYSIIPTLDNVPMEGLIYFEDDIAKRKFSGGGLVTALIHLTETMPKEIYGRAVIKIDALEKQITEPTLLYKFYAEALDEFPTKEVKWRGESVLVYNLRVTSDGSVLSISNETCTWPNLNKKSAIETLKKI